MDGGEDNVCITYRNGRQWRVVRWVGTALVICTVVVSHVAFAGSPPPRAERVGPDDPPSDRAELPIETRAALIAEVERFRFGRRNGDASIFDFRYPAAVWVERARDVVRKTNLLRDRYGIRIDDEELSRELKRICTATREPGDLAEMFVVLGHDGVLVKEILIRPLLVDRLLQPRVSRDQDIQGNGGFESWWKARAASVSTVLPGSLHAESEALPAISQPGSRGLSADVSTKNGLSGGSGRWTLTMPPEGRRDHSAVWTGTEMIVWGGHNNTFLGDGGIYDPVTDSWRPTPSAGAPAPRAGACSVWTGEELIVWGGRRKPTGEPFDEPYERSGAMLDPVADSWTPISTEGAPSGANEARCVWTGTEMIVWGGRNNVVTLESRADRYDPATDTWAPTSTTTWIADEVIGHTAVWTGDEIIVWGGWNWDLSYYTDRGARYDPGTDTWTALPASGLSSRQDHTAVWTSSEMVVWGGYFYDNGTVSENTGARYDPSSNSWEPMSIEGVPEGREDHIAVWTGDRMIVWGGVSWADGYDTFDSGSLYDPVTDSWEPTATLGAATPRSEHSGVWTGNELLVWGGYPAVSRGGRYNPATDSWLPTSASTPSDRNNHTAVWSGQEMIVWGGRESGSYDTVSSGAKYDPTLDAWVSMSESGAPSPRDEHIAVWADGEMIVWGGEEDSYLGPYLDTGGRYDPVTDSWSPTSTTDSPEARMKHSAVWTGDEMVVWGGWLPDYSRTATGGRYRPATNTWVPTSTELAPLGRGSHSAVWTGEEMIVWGGTSPAKEYTGGRYSPISDSWLPTSIVGTPWPRSGHTAVWTGTEMLVWGDGYDTNNEGGRYSPETDSWTVIPDAEPAPTARDENIAVWTGYQMIVWGGVDEFGSHVNTGGMYDPATDTWLGTDVAGAPVGRASHTGVWTGTQLILWGGVPGTGLAIFEPPIMFKDGFETGDSTRWSYLVSN